ncbi:zinc finger BED domain-containing protein RICESLEEPER 2-like [Senna tora]|uniref:Zinc finger BED domain-containing protein RICESLEEPER 2-like n=1 Tax=Senna tora TaxID=362788 RepID=A0A834SPN9_9FABA|nr:zinc finger BED domain-containing protein RICESLEEPER 2-like [Senna tora]
MVFAKKMSKEDQLESKTEVEIYLAEAREKLLDKFDNLKWWKVSSSKYPILALIARDVFGVPMPTVASESTFSTGGHILDPYRSSLSPRMVDVVICAQNCIEIHYCLVIWSHQMRQKQLINVLTFIYQ